MAQISRRKIKDEDYNKIFSKFVEVIENVKSKKDTERFINEFFFPTERIMFAKRIGIIYMIIRKIPDRTIAEILSVSTSTVGRLIDKLDMGEYRYLETLLRKTKDTKMESENEESLIDLIERLVMVFPPKGALKRYREIRQKRGHRSWF